MIEMCLEHRDKVYNFSLNANLRSDTTRVTRCLVAGEMLICLLEISEPTV